MFAGLFLLGGVVQLQKDNLVVWLNHQFQLGFNAVTLKVAEDRIPKLPIISKITSLPNGMTQVYFHPKTRTKIGS
jgi:hypothetical protein